MRNDECPHCEGKAPCKSDVCALAERIAEKIRAKGLEDVRSVRDGIHEVCHALQWKLKGKWTRDKITKKNPWKRVPQLGISDEITARAVEALAMRQLGLPYEQDKWILIMVMETLKFDRIALPSHEWALDAVTRRMETDKAKQLASQILETFS